MAKSGKQSSKAEQASARARLAEERRKAEGAARRNRMFKIAAGAVALLLVVVGVIIAVGMNRDRGGSTGSDAYVSTLANIPTADLDAVGAGSMTMNPSTPISGGEVQTEDGKPRLLYIGAEYCVYCGFTRWPLTIALERFGDFDGLHAARTPAGGALSNVPTVSYLNTTYTSDHLVFKGYEVKDAQGRDIETLSPADEEIARTHGMQGYPWLYWGTHTSGTPFTRDFLDSGALPGKTGDEVAAKLADTTSPEAQAILGAANVTTAQICALTGDQPSDVCTSPGVVAAKAVLG